MKKAATTLNLLLESRWRRSRIKSEREPYGFDVCVSRELEGATRRLWDRHPGCRGRVWNRAGVSDDLRLLFMLTALYCLVWRHFFERKSARGFDRRCSTSFRIDVLVRVLCPAANIFSLADPSVVGDDRRVAAIPEAIPWNYHNRWRYDLDRGFGLVLRVLHSGADAAHVNARWQWRGAAIHFAANQPESGADSRDARQNSRARLFRHVVFSMHC